MHRHVRRIRIETGDNRSQQRCVFGHGMTQEFAYYCRPEGRSHHRTRKSVYGQGLRKHLKRQSALHYRCQEHYRYNHRRGSPEEQRYEQHLLLNAIIYKEIEIA